MYTCKDLILMVKPESSTRSALFFMHDVHDASFILV